MRTGPCFTSAAASLWCVLVLGACSTTDKNRGPESASTGADGKAIVVTSGKAVASDSGDYDDLDEYAAEEISDPLEPVNRATFWFNDKLYTVVLRPVANGYEFVVPKPLRKALTNAFENVKYPVRVVNHSLQGEFERAGLETGKFLVNTTAGVGGLIRVSDKVPALSDVPSADTGQTFAKWGVDHGFYVVIPVFGPNSARDTVGLVGDLALNPVTWVGFIFGGGYFWGGPTWTSAITGTNTLRALPDQLDTYDAATENAVDKYLAARASWVQYRKAQAER